MNSIHWYFALILLSFVSCKREKTGFPSPAGKSNAPKPIQWDEQLTKELYYDKVLGMLVGSAIGDAMGAPTEMWHRHQIKAQYGYVDSMDIVTREGSPEGPWETNLPAGATTDDTRWKFLMGKFLTQEGKPQDSLNDKAFAQFIIEHYTARKKELKNADELTPQETERRLRHTLWLQEWANVSVPYLAGDLTGYSYALNKFYGGEMACAGMLYAPVVGAYYPAMPDRAYREAYRLGFFDLGYARDITGLTAAYVSEAMKPGATIETITKVTRITDPLNYFDSRLINRSAYRIHQTAKSIVHEAKSLTTGSLTPGSPPKNFKRDTLFHHQLQKAYALLENNLQDIPFHAAEIHLINLTALEFSEGDFAMAMEFIVNFGRDNDTVAAVTGAILGAYWGASGLPPSFLKKALQINKEIVGIDLELLAEEITEAAFRN